jgi:hypothetical protein
VVGIRLDLSDAKEDEERVAARVSDSSMSDNEFGGMEKEREGKELHKPRVKNLYFFFFLPILVATTENALSFYAKTFCLQFRC